MLMRAAENGQTTTVQALLAHGADIHAMANRGETALILAALYGHTDIVEELLDKGANIEVTDSVMESTALIWAAQNGHTAIVEALLAKGAAIEAKDIWGKSALMHAAESRYSNTVQALLAAGAVIKADDARNDFLQLYAILEKLAYTQGLALAVGDVRSHVRYYLKNMGNNKILHRDDIVSIYQEIQNKANSEKYKNFAKKKYDPGEFADTVRLSDLDIDPSALYRLYCAEFIYKMEKKRYDIC